MSDEVVSTPLVLRYVYAIVAIIILAVGTAIGSLYLGQADEISTRDRVQSYHLESAAEGEELAREVRKLDLLLESQVDSDSSRLSGAADIQSVQIGPRGILYSMRSRIARLRALQEQHDDRTLSTALQRIEGSFDELQRALANPQVSPETVVLLEVLGLRIQQFDRLHQIAADRELVDLAERQSHRPRYLVVLAGCLGLGTLAVWLLIRSLRASLLRQKRAEAALAESQERLHHIQKLDAWDDWLAASRTTSITC